ncbi:ribonuclease H-like domain-containing protein [Pseudoalteromonas piratica]|uniref:YprB ribonuclease H-like domain-containing protein n=1 Tax=Pseudoalteromonas piratica TaxID=1348114 RepID=A0A0A7EGN1_9GAMM|nr:ribonuclease H-like domain-containing protein [Pseudoalteromonas piratica]AIY65221.1 hypothetical protein OM33_08640 [Pseudoalteromonas piratica]
MQNAFNNIINENLMNKSIVFDVGTNLIGIMDTNETVYRHYYGSNRLEAIELLENATEIVSFNGKKYDIKEVNKVSIELREIPFSPKGTHTDILNKCWDYCFAGSLDKCFKEIIGADVTFPDTHLGSNEKDVYQTLMLWKHLYRS